MTLAAFFEKLGAWRSTIARVLLFGGVAFAATRMLPSIPREQILLFRLDGPGVVRRLDATWAIPGKSEPMGGVTLHIGAPPPGSVRHAVSLPNGPYVFEISIERAQGETDPSTPDSVAGGALRLLGTGERPEPPKTSYVRRVNLAGGETVIRL
jgi:hypothetical protein